MTDAELDKIETDIGLQIPFFAGGYNASDLVAELRAARKRMAEAEAEAEAQRDGLAKALGGWDADDLVELHRMIPDLDAVLTWNPLSKVSFRAGLLACRETMARFVEQGGSGIEKSIGQSIRANWWPSIGPDPGPPRQLHYDEVADEKPSGRIDHKPMDPSVEALPRAFSFIHALAAGREAEGK